jgi:hypothetical protein
VLSLYQIQTTQLLQNPAATTALYATSDITSYINRARVQLAGETECVRVYGTLQMTYGVVPYSFSSIAVPTGVSAVFNVRGATLNIASGQIWLAPRPFPYFQLYYLNNPVPQPGVPAVYSQFGQGENGTLYFSPLPDFNYVANVDAVCVPQALVDDTTVEAIPAPYTDAVPYYAAYLAFLSAQRAADADRMFQEYSKFASRARQMSNGSVNPGQYPQQPDPTRANLLGAQPQQGG